MKLLVLLLAGVSTAFCGQLDVAVIQFNDARDAAVLSAALARVELRGITDADRTRTKEEALKGGQVLFAQSFPCQPGSSFATSTRLGNSRADVKGALQSNRLSVSVDLLEGVQAGLRNYQTRSYAGTAPLTAGPAALISLRATREKSPTTVRGQSKVETTERTTIIAAQYSS